MSAAMFGYLVTLLGSSIFGGYHRYCKLFEKRTEGNILLRLYHSWKSVILLKGAGS